MSLSTNLTLGNTRSDTTKVTVVWSPVDVGVNLCFSHQTIEGHLVDDKGELDELCVMRYEV